MTETLAVLHPVEVMSADEFSACAVGGCQVCGGDCHAVYTFACEHEHIGTWVGVCGWCLLRVRRALLLGVTCAQCNHACRMRYSVQWWDDCLGPVTV